MTENILILEFYIIHYAGQITRICTYRAGWWGKHMEKVSKL